MHTFNTLCSRMEMCIKRCMVKCDGSWRSTYMIELQAALVGFSWRTFSLEKGVDKQTDYSDGWQTFSVKGAFKKKIRIFGKVVPVSLSFISFSVNTDNF